MAKKKKAQGKPCVWVCRGCCCGTDRQHPGVPHKRLLKLVRSGAKAAGARFEVTDCLGPCAQGNVVVVRLDGQIRWFRRMNDEEITGALVAHLMSRAPLSGLRDQLSDHIMHKRNGRKPDW